MRAIRPFAPSLRLALLLAALLLPARAPAFDAIHAFGDSLTDTGRAPAPAPDYFQGRYSNGPLWVEYLSTKLGLTYNAANNHAVSGGETSDALAQVQQSAPPANPAQSVFVVWAGGNDFIHNFTQGLNETFWNNLIVQSVGNLSNAVVQLYAGGARMIVVPNQMDLSRLPVVLDSGQPALVLTYLRGKVDKFNGALAVALTALANAHPDLQLLAPDVHARVNDLLGNLGALGFAKADPDALSDPQLTDKSFGGPGQNYVFWDEIHPTTKAHAFVAGWFYETIAAATPVNLNLVPDNNAFSFSVNTLLTGASFVLQRSTALPAWEGVQTFALTSTAQRVSIPTNGLPHGFFRLKLQP